MRRTPSRTGAAAALLCFQLGTSAPAATQSPAMFRGDPAHHGVAPSAPFAGQGGLLWRHRFDGAVRSTPAIQGGQILVGSSDGRLYALDQRSGRERWRFDAGGAITSSPAIAGGLAVAMTHSGRIFAVDARSGRLRWSRQTGAELPFNTYPAGRWDVYASSPVVAGTTVIIGGADGLVYAVDLATGTPRWTAKTGGRVRATPAVHENLVVVGSWDGRVYALDLATGAERWVHRTAGDTLDSHAFGFDRRAIQSSAAIAGGGVFVGSRDGALYGLDLRTGERRWRATHRGSWVVGSPSVRGDTVWVGSSDGQFVQALDAGTGTELWRFESGANVLSSPLVAGNLLLVGTEANDAPWGDLLGLDAATGRLRWRLRLEEAIYGSPVVADGIIYVGTDGGELLAIGETVPAPVHLAVYYDSTLASRGMLTGGRLAREYFAGLGYQTLTAAGLRSFFLARIEDHAPSAVVFALDALPDDVRADTGATGAWQRYLGAGGKLVWLGTLPGTIVWDSGGRPLGNDLPLTRPLTGLNADSTDWDENSSHPTAEGRRWGLSGFWRGDMPTAPSVVSRVLALDTDGRATAWQVEYDRNRPWAGYVQLWGLGASVERLPMIRAVTEFGLLRVAGSRE